MSIAILAQVYDEVRRLAIAGSVVAGGDFRLKKLVAPLEQAGAKAPVFAKVAQAVQGVVEANEKTAASALLELATLVNAILYTQGETGAAGPLEPIESTDLGAATTQASARVLKPLMEALSTTGSGRLETIRQAHEQGAYRDLRLVKPALDALDDVYGEIADFVTDRVLPAYGKAILPELRTRFDRKGRAGHPRRLRLMHSLDPAGTRDLIKQALDDGSKEVRVVAVECLGAEPEDLSYLMEQATAKAQEVRQAAYRALSALDHEDAIAVLQKALTGKDIDLAAESIRRNRSGKLIKYVVAEADKEIESLAKTKDKKEIGQKIARVQALMNCMYGRQDKEIEAFVLRLYDQREELAKVKGDTRSGTDLIATVVGVLGQGSSAMQARLVESHATVAPEQLGLCFQAARNVLPASKVFDLFAPYLTAKVDEKKKQRDPAWAKRDAVCAALGGNYRYWAGPREEAAPLDPRWLDRAVAMKHLGLVRVLGRPGHAGAVAFLRASFDDVLKKAKSLDEFYDVLSSMAFTQHPDATDAVVAALEKHDKKSTYYAYWFAQLIPELPATAVPRLEALLPNLPDTVADSMLGFIQKLRDKGAGAH